MTPSPMSLRCACVLLAAAVTGSCQAAPGGGARATLEFTGADILAARNWNSSQVSVLGFRLGMTWPDVAAEARTRNLTLLGQGDARHRPACEGTGWCTVCEAPGLCGGLDLVFGPQHDIVKLSIGKIPDVAAKEVQANALVRRTKGSTLKLFESYSKELRLKLLGPEASQSTTGTKDIVFVYPRRGLVLQVSPCPEDLPESSCSGLILELVPPSPAR